MTQEEHPLKRVCIICSRGSLQDIYIALVLANGAVMEGIQAKMFFTFFGIDAITRNRMNHLTTSAVGNPALRLPGGLPLPNFLGIFPRIEAGISAAMKKRMDRLDLPPVREFLEMIDAGGGEIYACRLAMDLFHLQKEDLWEGVRGILTVGEFYGMCGGQQTQVVIT